MAGRAGARPCRADKCSRPLERLRVGMVGQSCCAETDSKRPQPHTRAGLLNRVVIRLGRHGSGASASEGAAGLTHHAHTPHQHPRRRQPPATTWARLTGPDPRPSMMLHTHPDLPDAAMVSRRVLPVLVLLCGAPLLIASAWRAQESFECAGPGITGAHRGADSPEWPAGQCAGTARCGGRAAHLRAQPGRSVLCAGLRTGAGPALADGDVPAHV